MSRSDFGWWGSELDDGEFAQALAALGVVVAQRHVSPPLGDLAGLKHSLAVAPGDDQVLPWRLISEPGELMRYHTPPDAPLLLQAWAEADWSPPPRLEIQPDSSGQSILPWIVEQLSRQEVKLSSVYAGLPAPPARVRWSWPLRVGLADDAESARLGDELREAWWARHLATFRSGASSGEPCDLFFLPWTLRRGLGELLRQPRPVRAHCVVVMGGVDTTWQQAHPQLAALLAHAHAAGVCIVSIPAAGAADWFNDLLRQLSHNHPLDVAFCSVAGRHRGARPLFFASRPLLASSRMSGIAQDLIRQLQRLPGQTEMRVPDLLKGIMQITQTLRPAADLAESLEIWLPDLATDHESEGASALAELTKEVADSLDEVPPANPRWIQGQVFEINGEGGPQRAARALRAGQRHLLVVRIGPADEEWLTPPAEAVFPEHRLPRDEQQHTLQVVFSEPDHAPQPQLATIILPREGASTTCQFPFRTRNGVPTFQGRVILLHRNRVLQTALLEGQVVPDPAEAAQAPSLQLSIESLLRPGLDDLQLRQDFDLAVVANHATDGRPGITSIAGGWAKFKSLGPQQDNLAADIGRLLEDIADRPDQYAHELAHDNNTALLGKLARLGNKLYEGLILDQVEPEQLQGIGRVQLVSATEAYLPIEFFYDLQSPRRDAPLCPRALVDGGEGGGAALRDGKCADCPEVGRRPAETVCPLGFWGMRLVIERHAVKPEWKGTLAGDDFALQSRPVPGRKPLRPLTNAVYAASDLVDEAEQGHIRRVFEALRQATQQHATQVTTWEEWKQVVGAEQPSLLLLLPHTTTDDEYEPQLEIGTGQKLVGEYISADHVRPAASKSAPVVVLVGCKTLQPQISVSSFPAYFRRRGAAVVLSTLTSVLGRHAGPVAEQLVDDLQHLAAEGEEERAFGYAMLRLRRRSLARGLLMVLCLVAHGDADYRLEPSDRSWP